MIYRIIDIIVRYQNETLLKKAPLNPYTFISPILFYHMLRMSEIDISAPYIDLHVTKHLKVSELEKKGLTPHSLRHSCATHLPQNGADIRYVQELLVHDSIQTTVCYTKDIVKGLEKLHKTYHPRENELYPEE